MIQSTQATTQAIQPEAFQSPSSSPVQNSVQAKQPISNDLESICATSSSKEAQVEKMDAKNVGSARSSSENQEAQQQKKTAQDLEAQGRVNSKTSQTGKTVGSIGGGIATVSAFLPPPANAIGMAVGAVVGIVGMIISAVGESSQANAQQAAQSQSNQSLKEIKNHKRPDLMSGDVAPKDLSKPVPSSSPATSGAAVSSAAASTIAA